VNPSERWSSFAVAFIEQIRASSDQALAFAWSTHEDRTRFYREDLLERVAGSLQLTLKREILLVDYALCETENGLDVPVIFIESENAIYSADQEIGKLASLSSPLRVLLSVGEWDRGVWSHAGLVETCLPRWRHIVATYERVSPRSGLIVALIGEWRSGTLYFHAHELTSGGCDTSAFPLIRVGLPPQQCSQRVVRGA